MSVAVAGRRAEAKERNRDALLGAGRDAFADLGYGATSVRDIVRRTPLATGTFYNYFPDKEAVFRALLDISARELRARVRAARLASASPEGFVRDAYRAFFSFIAEDPTMFALLRDNTATIRALLGDPILALGVDELLEDLAAAIGTGALPAFDADYMAGAMAGVGFEVGARMVERAPVDVEGAVTFASALFLGGMDRMAAEAHA